MLRDWTKAMDTQWTETEIAMRTVALAAVDVMRDDSIRRMTRDEEQILLAYLGGELELPHPPNFIKATMTQLHRAILEDIHEAHFNVALTANLPPTVNLKHNANLPHIELFKVIYTANTDGDIGLDMMRCLQSDVKRLIYDGGHTLRFVFYSRCAASHWVKQTIKFQRSVITLHDTDRRFGTAVKGSFTKPQLQQMYALHVFGGGKLGLAALSRALAQCAETEVLDVEYPRATKTETYDNRFHVVRFAQEKCPSALSGATMVHMDGITLTLHHFQNNLRLPCSKCYSQRHGTTKCRVAPDRQQAMLKKGSRKVTGSVAKFSPTELNTYKVQDIAELLALLTVQQGPMEAADVVSFVEQSQDTQTETEQDEAPANSASGQGESTDKVATEQDGALVQPVPTKEDDSTQPATEKEEAPAQPVVGQEGAPAQPAAGQEAVKVKTEEGSDRTGPTGPPADEAGYAVKTSERAKKAARKAAKEATHNTAPTAQTNTAAAGAPPKKSKKKTKASKSVKFADFQRAEAVGYYDGLVEDDGEDESDDDFEEAMSESNDVEMEETDDSDYPSDQLAQPNPPDEDMEDDAPTGTQHDSPTGQSDTANNRCTQSSESTPTLTAPQTNGGTPVGDRPPKPTAQTLVQTTMEYYVEGRTTLPAPALETGDDRTPTNTTQPEYVPATPESQEDFTMGDTHVGTAPGDADLLIQVAHWLTSFNGSEVTVASNGQCAFLAFFGTLSNHPPPVFTNSPSYMRQASAVKRGVYSLMMANLRHDVELGLLDPVTEYHRLYPSHPFHETPAAAKAALFAHYAQERTRTTGAQVPSSFWAGPHELRALAQYAREPLFVLDVNSAGDAHLQRYMCKEFRLRNGDDHETGYCEALTDRQARDYLHACWSLHVLPYFLILRHHQRHFYGVSHGEIFVKWRAEGDPHYTTAVADTFAWKETINILRPEDTVEMASVNKLADMDSVNQLLIKRITKRERLDVVHARLGLPTLDSTGYDDEEALEMIIETEERHIQEGYGLDEYASGSQGATEAEGAAHGLPTRYARVATGEITEVAYFRILRASCSEDISKEDTPQYHLFLAADAEAFLRWLSLYRKIFDIPTTRRRDTPRTLANWLLERTHVLRHLYAFLPYPEIEAKLWSLDQLVQWGTAEVYSEQVAGLWRVMQETDLSAAARDYCISWCEAATKGPISTKMAIAGEAARWRRLRGWVEIDFCRDNSTGLDATGWAILHVIPYVASTWATTPMGRAINGARRVWYQEFPFLRELCHNILDQGDWSASVFAPSGQTWADQCADGESDHLTSHRN